MQYKIKIEHSGRTWIADRSGDRFMSWDDCLTNETQMSANGCDEKRLGSPSGRELEPDNELSARDDFA
jgi:hypothetical protein